VHYGLLPRSNRGIFGLNELPDLAERIQVALFNVLEERDIQVRGYALRLPLDMLMVASANPEDYTNRGRIITPLKDRFGAEVRTHYPLDIADEIALIAQESELVAEVPDHLVEVVARLVDELRSSSAVDQRSGVSARFPVAAVEGAAAAALRRGSLLAEDRPVARVGDLPGVLSTLRGKIEFEMGEEGREAEVIAHLFRLAVVSTYRDRLAGVDLHGFTEHFTEGDTVETGAHVTSSHLLAQLGTVPGLAAVLHGLGVSEDNVSPGQVASAVEFVLEALHLTRRLDKANIDGTTVYGG
jgi:magnesium chelatase subunit I